MKKYRILFFITFLLIATIIFSTNYFKSTVKEIEAIYLDPITVGDYVNCTGKLEYADAKEIFIDQNCMVKEIYAKEGDKISKGDKIMSIIKLPDEDNKIFSDKYKEQLKKYNDVSSLKEAYNSYLRQGNLQRIKKTSTNINTNETNPIVILSDYNGIISSINVHADSILKKGDSIANVSEHKAFQVNLNINESRISNIKLGQKVVINGVGFKNKEYNGTVSNISNEAKQVINSTGAETAVEVKVLLDDCEDLENIKPGFTAKCKIQTDENKNILVIPYNMVKSDNSGKEYVYKYKNGYALKSYITTGKEFEEGFEVLNGIDYNDMIITTPDLVYNKSYVKLT